MQFNDFPFSVKGDWPDELLFSREKPSLCTCRTGMASWKIEHSLKAMVHSVLASATEFFSVFNIKTIRWKFIILELS